MIKGRYTPWDESVLKVRTFEIQDIDLSDEKLCLELLKTNDFCDANLIYGRFLSSNLKIKEVLLKSGYFICETSLIVNLKKLDTYVLPSIYARRKLELSILDNTDYWKIANISQDMFKYSRFHEDPFIPINRANARMSQWVNDLANQDVTCLVNKSHSNEILSFMIFKLIKGNSIELILGGSKKGYELHSPFFWGSIIDYFKQSGYLKISSTISAANMGVLSLYQNLGFKIIKVNNDYHKHILI
ncbi:hypothetical protein Q4574_00460 [Aliiglaciecola sp. 3_MG-2023]|uniref:hypothetical protein n=1 Tax=Aliiglaciecola sp. 3_MG-2023 TaxID=3062644 RepID=UPI0026E1BB53|nr:hypothetical protein [Aliiglaciecola sp. 3_MG-2023]MDO6691727.1 hypothetical protein [Aliiglaciecola sp. 3_MG-2023]